MRIIIEEPFDGEEEQIIFKCRTMNREILHLIALAKAQQSPITAYDGNKIHRISPSAVFYFESIDNKVFVYCSDQVLESKKKLYEIESILSDSGFIRVSKSVVLNIAKIKTLAPAYSGRFEAALENGEKVIISRQYVTDLKNALKI